MEMYMGINTRAQPKSNSSPPSTVFIEYLLLYKIQQIVLNWTYWFIFPHNLHLLLWI